MARITVEDCLSKVDNQYDLVLLAKERASQLNAGNKPLVPENNDKNTVISLREIGEGKISVKTLEDSVINKLMKVQIQPTELEDLEIEEEDNFDKIYKGEVSKSGTAILPSKRARRMPEKIITAHEVENDETKKDTKQTDEKVKQTDEKVKQTDEKVRDDSLPAEKKTE